MQTHLKDIQRTLRKTMTAPELVLWERLRYSKARIKFRRQYTFGNYILDFYSPAIKLAIEIDGESHFIDSKAQNQDLIRDNFLKKNNLTILRFTNSEIMRNLEGCLEKIGKTVDSCKSPTLPPPL